MRLDGTHLDLKLEDRIGYDSADSDMLEMTMEQQRLDLHSKWNMTLKKFNLEPRPDLKRQLATSQTPTAISDHCPLSQQPQAQSSSNRTSSLAEMLVKFGEPESPTASDGESKDSVDSTKLEYLYPNRQNYFTDKEWEEREEQWRKMKKVMTDRANIREAPTVHRNEWDPSGLQDSGW